MTVKDVESRTGLERANIRFYEKEGLLSPVRAENGYRDYSEEDVQVLLRIKLLRQVHLTLEEIKALQAGELELTAALQSQIAALEREQQAAENAQKLCRWMVEDGAAFQTLDAEKYLRNLPEPVDAAFAADDMDPQAFCPWRRFFARYLDLNLYGTLFTVILGLTAGIPLQNISNIATAIAAVALMLVTEPLLLHLFGTTPGKYCFGLSIESAEGGRLSYKDAFARTAGALGNGCAFQIPIVNLYTLWKSYKCCVNHESQPWEKETPVNYSFRYGNGGCALRSAAVWVLLFALTAVTAGAQRIVPNRGELTVAEFVENVNHVQKHYLEDAAYMLDESGQWEWENTDIGTYVINAFGYVSPELEYTMDGETVRAVSFSAEGGGDTLISLPFTDMAVLTMGLAGAGKEAGFKPKTLAELGNQVLKSGNDFTDRETNEFFLSQYGMTVSWSLTQQGYHMNGGMLVPDKDDAEYTLSFRVERT